MSKYLFVFFLGSLVAAYSAVQNTHHDFSGSGWANGEICVACHTPHNANQTITASPLWNHDVTSNSYSLYSSPTLDAAPGQPNSISKLCLSCHDGTVALDAFGGNTGTSYIRTATSRNVPIRISGDLTDHHPVAFIYNGALATVDGGLKDPNTSPSGLGGTIASDLLNGGIMECSSCHDVHVSRGSGSCTDCHGFVFPNYYQETLSLVKSNDNSDLCYTCHNK